MKKIAIIFMVILLAGSLFAADKGNIAIASKGKTPASEVSEVAARAPYFLIFDSTGKFLGAFENPFTAAKGGAGTAVVSFLEQKGAGMVVAGGFGMRMLNALSSQGMRYMEFRGTVDEALKKALGEVKR